MSKTSPTEADERAAILEVLHRSRIAVWTHDFPAYESCFVHADYLTRWNAARHVGVFRRVGWEDISARVKKTFEDASLLIPQYAYDTPIENLELRISGDMAWATFDQIYPSIGRDRLYYHGSINHEVRLLERHDGKWLIAFLGIMHGAGAGRPGSPTLQVTADGTVTWQSADVRAALEADDDLTIRNGRIRFRDSKADKKLQAALRWAAERDTGLIPHRGTLPIVIEAGEGLPAKIYWVFAEGGMIIMSLHVPGIDAERLDVAAAIFDLSPAQKEVAGLVVEGMSLPDIADRMEISANTARTHLNRVFEKTGVRTQPALVRVLLSSAPPV